MKKSISNNNQELSWSENPENPVSDFVENENENEKKKKTFITLFKTFSMMILAFALLVFVGIAWFAMNKNVGTDGMRVSVQSDFYEIEVRGNYKENSDLIGKMNIALFGTDSGTNIFVDGEKVDESNPYYQTTSGKNKIVWRKAVQDTDHGHYDVGLEPNAGGKMEFWVVAKEAGTYDPVFTFEVDGFHSVSHQVEQDGVVVDIVDYLFEINSSLVDHRDVDASLIPTMVDKKIAALEYIKGHILFFKDRDADGYYSGFLGNGRTFSLSDVYPEEGGTTFTKGEKKPVTVYWKWANTFEQMIYDSSYSSYAPLLRDATSADRTALNSYLYPTNSKMFLGLSDNTITEKLTIVQSHGEGFEQAVSELSDAYNDADQEIGDMVHYITIEMTVGEN